MFSLSVLASLIQTAYSLYSYILLGHILFSWIPVLKETPLGRFLQRLSEPYLKPFRFLVPPLGVLDVSPVVALFVLYFAKEGVLFLLQYLVQR